ncbi:MAG: hypothetical protein IKG14_01845 [Clostridia bacterium]|nr:hypothetical protein [Bacilli bacterium]MBR3324777.1 hypothetical protein [Clostridia bacterium]
MKENIELEVSLEVIMSKIADAIFKLTSAPNENNEKELRKLIDIQEKAYQGDGDMVSKILHS